MFEIARNTVKRIGAIGLVVLVGVTFPLLIWAAAVFCLTHIYREWRALKGWVQKENLACSIDTDCPPGYVCAGGRCLPNTTG